MKKPENAEAYGWYSFISWCDRNGVDYEACDEWELFWECWKAGYCAATEETYDATRAHS